MLNERRQHQRYKINRIAKFRADATALPRDCMITDISQAGARLFIDGTDVPDSFELFISGEERNHKQCRVMWRLGGEVGVAFVGPGMAEPRFGR